MSVATANRQIRLASRPAALPAASDWEHSSEPIGEPGPGELLIQVTHISLDPGARSWMDADVTYMPPVEIGEVMRALAAGRVVASNNSDFPEGSTVFGLLGVQEYAISDGAELQIIDTEKTPAPRYMGSLGLPGLTAYFALLDLGKPQPGDVVVVSGAAGAVGNVAAQIAKIAGCRTIGIAGGPEKCAWLTDELGIDAAVDYKSEDVAARLDELAPDGINVFFDNVGGEILDAVLARLALGARVALCGNTSQYNSKEEPWGPDNYFELVFSRATMSGMLIFDHQERFPEARERLAGWLEEGRLVAREHVVRGQIDQFPETFLALFAGENTGKFVLELEH